MRGLDVARLLKSDSPLNLEKKVQVILQNKFDSGDPFCQYAALKIWYGYWKLRGSKNDEVFESYINRMQNLVRPFAFKRFEQPVSVFIKQSDPILQISKPMLECDGLAAPKLPIPPGIGSFFWFYVNSWDRAKTK